LKTGKKTLNLAIKLALFIAVFASWLPRGVQEASAQATTTIEPQKQEQPSDVQGSQLAEVFPDASEVEQVAGDKKRVIVREFLANNPNAKKYTINQVSKDYEQDSGRPALKLNHVWIGEKTVLLELLGLPRRSNEASAIMRKDTLRIKTRRGSTSQLIGSEGAVELRDRRGGSALIVAPGDTLHLVFEKFDDFGSYALSHVNRDGRESVYFDPIDPRFRERYDAMFAATSTPLGMKDFLVEFSTNDPDKRLMPVFTKFIGEMRNQRSFEGHYAVFQLMSDPKDYQAMKSTAVTEEHKAIIKSIEDEKQAEIRRREEIRQAELRKQEAVRREQQKVADARAAEERCLITPSCRQEMQARQAACVDTINACRRQCDSMIGGGSGFFGGLASAVLVRGCASQCKCDNGFGALFAKLSTLESGSSSSFSSSSSSSTASKTNARTDSATSKTESSPKVFVCKIYCKSSNGPTIERETRADSRAQAARILGDKADQLCYASGNIIGNAVKLPESQCWQK
jgi:hypothetical protein